MKIKILNNNSRIIGKNRLFKCKRKILNHIHEYYYARVSQKCTTVHKLCTSFKD